MKNFASIKNNAIKIMCLIFFSLVSISCGQENKSSDHNMNHKSTQVDSSIVHEGEIDLLAIDLNKDGKVFQDPMDWNVISDDPGKCPLCGMKLKEVTLDKASENLIKHGFEVK